MQAYSQYPLDRFPKRYEPKIPAEEIVSFGRCQCGCGEEVTEEYVYLYWKGNYFIDPDHLVEYMKNHCELEEVG